MSTANTSILIPAQSTNNIQPVITAENAKWMVKEAARVTMQALRGLQGQDAKHWGKVAQLVWAQLPKSHPYYKVMEELTRPLSSAKHQAQPVDKGKGKSWVQMRLKGFSFWTTDMGSKDAPTETMARTTGVVMQKLGNEEDQNREKAWGHSQSRCGQPASKPVNASDQTSRGQCWSRRPMKKAKPAVNEDVQDHSINQSTSQTSKGTKLKSICWSIQSNKPSFISWPMDWPPQSIATDPPITPAPTTTTGANDPCHCDEYWEEVTILKQENADMRQEIDVTHTELAALHWVPQTCLTILWSHFTLLPTLHQYLTCWSWWNLALQLVLLRFNHPEAAQDRSPLNPPPASFEGGAGLEMPPSNVKAVHGPAGGLAISITPPPPPVGSVPRQEDAAIYSVLSKCDLQEEVATATGSCSCMIQILENQSGMVIMMVTFMVLFWLAGGHKALNSQFTCTGMVLVPVHTYTVDLLPGGQAGQAWHGIISGQASMALVLGQLDCWPHGIGDVLELITMVLGLLPQHWCCAGTHYNGAQMACMMDSWHWCCAGTHYNGARMAFMMAPWHWGCAGTHYTGARMACMMDLWHWGYARIHGTGARPASMALVRCWYTLQWCQNGLHDRPHGIGDVPEYMAWVPGWLPWHWWCAGTHSNGARMACMMAPWHWGCAGTHGPGARPSSMMAPWQWQCARTHGIGASMASMALALCQFTLNQCQLGQLPWH
ncbi:hypothetical protein F5J12DRAFT_787568 [Pisolithus orientalis]|uniref:uncharacterized protein n=1 Tax=Pisolithus orientalis TaxID=936130 RepID=UPI00222493C0|nr:uncharacterized protein F5J12DRAFT_787568 [Pisolithus orientalis]KAI5984486.1 hypothetical protein F5J12DRAFT_787568 [Pisolithus orientalis]